MHANPWMVAAALALWPCAALADTQSRANALLGQASELVVQQHYREAEPLLRHTIELRRDLPRAHYNLAVALRETNRLEEAVDEYRIAFDRFDPADEPARSQCLYGVALAEEDLGHPAEAAQAWSAYVNFARRFTHEQAAVAIARQHLVEEEHLADVRQPQLGTRKAAR